MTDAIPLSTINTEKSRFYLNHPYPGMVMADQPVARLFGNRVLLVRIHEGHDSVNKIGRFYHVDTYQKGQVTFTVLAVGPGEWIKRRNKRVWIQPEVQPGDFVVSNHWNIASTRPAWHQPHYMDTVDGRGRVIVDARFIECIFGRVEQ